MKLNDRKTQAMNIVMNSLIHWNINGFYNKYEEFKILQLQFNPIAVLLSETHFRPNQAINIRNFIVYHSEPQLQPCDRVRGGIAIFIQEQYHMRLSNAYLNLINPTSF